MFFIEREFLDEKYKAFIRQLPCCVTGEVHNIEAHHSKDRAHVGADNDYSCVPLVNHLHTGRGFHMSQGELAGRVGEPLAELCLLYNAMYINFLHGKYDPVCDASIGYRVLREKKKDLFKKKTKAWRDA